MPPQESSATSKGPAASTCACGTKGKQRVGRGVSYEAQAASAESQRTWQLAPLRCRCLAYAPERRGPRRRQAATVCGRRCARGGVSQGSGRRGAARVTARIAGRERRRHNARTSRSLRGHPLLPSSAHQRPRAATGQSYRAKRLRAREAKVFDPRAGACAMSRTSATCHSKSSLPPAIVMGGRTTLRRIPAGITCATPAVCGGRARCASAPRDVCAYAQGQGQGQGQGHVHWITGPSQGVARVSHHRI